MQFMGYYFCLQIVLMARNRPRFLLNRALKQHLSPNCDAGLGSDLPQ